MRKVLLPVLLFLAGCGVGGALAASGGGGGGGGDTPPKPPPPFVTVTTPPTEVSNYVTVSYELNDPQVKGPDDDPPGPNDPRVRVTPQFQLREDGADPDVWFDMTEADVRDSQGTRALSLGGHTFVWNTLVDIGAYIGETRVRVLASYEDATGIDRRFRSPAEVFDVDNRRADTIFGFGREPVNDVLTFPDDLRPDGDGFLVADFGSNIVERVDAVGTARRLLGVGVPGDNVTGPDPTMPGTPRHPGSARLPTLVGVEQDAAGNLYTNHDRAIFVTNRMTAGSVVFGELVVAPQTVANAYNLEDNRPVGVPFEAPLTSSRGIRFHPSGALVFLNNAVSGATVDAFNPAAAGPDIVLAGVTIPAGQRRTIAGGGTDPADGAPALSALLQNLTALAIGPDGEIYYAEGTLSRVRVLNPNAAPVTVGGNAVAPATVFTVAGNGVPGDPEGTNGDMGLARSAQLIGPNGIDVRASDRALFISDNGFKRVRLVNLGSAPVTFAETTVEVGEIDTAVGGGTGGDGSRARGLALLFPNTVAVDADGNLLVGDEGRVVFVNGTTATVTEYGRTTGPSRTSVVYDASRRGGVPVTEPRAMHSNAPTEVFFTDRTSIRVLNLTRTTRTFGGAAADAGATAVVAGGSVEGFGGDGGSARSATFAFPSGLALEGTRRLYVADTGNDRVRLVNIGDPRVGGDTEVVLGRTISAGNVDTVIGGAPGPAPDDGDGLAPSAAVLLAPESVAVGSDGLVYVADTGHHRIRVVNPGAAPVVVAGITVAPGTIETIVGTGVAGDSPDGPGPWAIDSPSAVTLDNRNTLYFALRGNSKVRALNLSDAPVQLADVTIQPNEVGTLAGTGVPGNTGDGGSGTAAQIDAPRALFVQSNAADNTPFALYFSDEDAHVVRMVNLRLPDDPNGDLVLELDATGEGVRRTAPAASIVTVAGGPNTPGFPNTPAFAGDMQTLEFVRFARPFGIAVTNFDGRPAHFFVADSGNLRVRRFGAPPLVQ